MVPANRFAKYLESHKLMIALGSLSLFIILSLQIHRHPSQQSTIVKQHILTYQLSSSAIQENYVVFGSNTPNGESYRTYDYAFNLPLTALAWERIGFKSIVLIIGSRCEWENDPTLSLILSYLEARRATVIFVSSPLEYRPTLSQTARAFTVNFPEFPGKDGDFLITSDSDLWPLRKEHFVPRPDMDVVLVHSGCCGFFQMNNKSYPMYPMSNIGATVSTWRQIMNDNHSMAYDSESILNYLGDVFGEMARSPVVVAQPTWYMDQRMTSIRLTEWMEKNGQGSVYRVSDVGFSRLDRNEWNADILMPENFTHKFDAHLPVKIYLPVQWNRIVRPLLNLMYGKDSWQTKWCEDYAREFSKKVTNYLNFASLG
uniref:Uncharacterized protein n=1 Tax=Daphnia galeata TaxID=27404 RepID=A0A8J2RUX4_9CRUS|nr:unnamed protein product [Daphnia galeata]